MQKETNIKKLNCPSCGLEMDIRIQNLMHINKSTGEMKKHKYYQYFCSECDSKETGWTTTESDELSLFKLNKFQNTKSWKNQNLLRIHQKQIKTKTMERKIDDLTLGTILDDIDENKEWGRQEIVDYLLSYGVEITPKTSNSNPPTFKSVCVEVLEELLQRPDVLIDAIRNESTNWDATTLTDFGFECIAEAPLKK